MHFLVTESDNFSQLWYSSPVWSQRFERNLIYSAENWKLVQAISVFKTRARLVFNSPHCSISYNWFLLSIIAYNCLEYGVMEVQTISEIT